jgi:hypothetical protein
MKYAPMFFRYKHMIAEMVIHKFKTILQLMDDDRRSHVKGTGAGVKVHLSCALVGRFN